MSTILDSAKLIKSIRRRAMLPTDEQTFLLDDYLEMATEEINIGLMADIISLRSEHLIYFEDIPLTTGINRYAIPYRAHGVKLRGAALVASGDIDSVYELSQISIDELSDYHNGYTSFSRSIFYIENNELVIVDSENSSFDKLRMWFYLRPNQLVLNERGTTVQSMSRSYEIDNLNPLSGTVSNISVSVDAPVFTSVNHGLVSGQYVVINGSNSTPSVDGNHMITFIDADHFSIEGNTTVAGTTASYMKLVECDILQLSSFPKNFDLDTLFDFVQSRSPNKIIYYDKQANSIDDNVKTISFPVGSLTDPSLILKAYITQAEETIVPNLPSEMHPILAQRVAVHCLEALGDEQGKQSAERKLVKMEKAAGVILSNRVEGSPRRVRNRHSTLVQTQIRRNNIRSV